MKNTIKVLCAISLLLVAFLVGAWSGSNYRKLNQKVYECNGLYCVELNKEVDIYE